MLNFKDADTADPMLDASYSLRGAISYSLHKIFFVLLAK
jgi:hypothetical protein